MNITVLYLAVYFPLVLAWMGLVFISGVSALGHVAQAKPARGIYLRGV